MRQQMRFFTSVVTGPQYNICIMLIMKIKKIYAQKTSLHYGRKSLPNWEKLIGNYFYPGNSDVYAGSCNNAVVKILIIEVPC